MPDPRLADLMASIQPQPITDEIADKARKVIAGNSESTTEAELFLRMVGLLDG